MDTNHEHSNHLHSNPEVMFDKTDLSARGILVFFAVLAISGILIHVAVFGMYRAYDAYANKHDVEVSPLAKPQRAPEAAVLQNTPSPNLERIPQPRLQTDDTTDMRAFLSQEEILLKAKPWKDQQGNIHLPVEDAMKLIAQRGLPTRSGPAAQPDYPGVGRTYSGNLELQRIGRTDDTSRGPEIRQATPETGREESAPERPPAPPKGNP